MSNKAEKSNVLFLLVLVRREQRRREEKVRPECEKSMCIW